MVESSGGPIAERLDPQFPAPSSLRAAQNAGPASRQRSGPGVSVPVKEEIVERAVDKKVEKVSAGGR